MLDESVCCSCRKTHPGPVVHLSDNPLDASKLLLHFALTTCRPRDRNNCLLTAPAPVKCTPLCLLTIDPSCCYTCALTTCRPRDRKNSTDRPAPVKCTPLCLPIIDPSCGVTLRPDHLSTHRPRDRNNCLLTAPAPAKCTPLCLLTIDPSCCYTAP
ncbi:hypothetical protein J6590_016404 [Homalodisca vitripennis]|nr:hypothetical protein J6590_016404 [Homalodisca vitripennis]